MAQAVPATPATDPALKINWNPVTETWRNLRLAHRNIVVFRSLLGISWMWFFGAVFLGLFPSFARNVLHGNEQVASLLLVVFSVGIGSGALLCEVLSRRHVEIGLVPLGAIGMSVFAVDLYFASRSLPPAAGLTVAQFVGQAAHWRVLADLGLLALFAGIYSVPMYALIQMRSQPTHRARIIAANNILNALFMIVSAAGVGLLLAAGFTIPQVLLAIGLLNAVVAFYIFMLVPEYLLRFVAFVATRCVYRFKVRGDEHIPATGRGHAGVQPRQLRRRGAADGGQPAADPLHHGPPHLRHSGAGLDVQAGQGHPDRVAQRRSGRLRGGLRAGRPGAGRRRPAVHLSRRRDHARRPARRVQGRHHEDPADPPGAGGAGGAEQPVGLVLLARRAGHGDGAALPPRCVQRASAWWPGRRCRRRR